MVMLVRAAALTGYAALAQQCGLDASHLLRLVGLPLNALQSPEMQVSAGKVGRLLELSALAADREDFGLTLGATREPTNLGLAAVVAREAPTLRQAIVTLIRYLPLHNQVLHVRLEDLANASLIALRFDSRDGRPIRQSVGLSMAVLQKVMASLFADDWRPEVVCFAHTKPRDTMPYQRFFNARLQFDAGSNGMICSEGDLDRVRPVQPTLQGRDAEAYLEALLSNASEKLDVRARNEICAMLSAGRCTAEDLAHRLGTSRRTLHRQLTATGTSYNRILDEVRQELVLQCLGETPRPLAELAAILNFEDPSVLARWFRSRFGCSIKQWRATGRG